VITHMLQDTRNSFTAEGAKCAEKALLTSLCDLSVLCSEIWVITRYLLVITHNSRETGKSFISVVSLS